MLIMHRIIFVLFILGICDPTGLLAGPKLTSPDMAEALRVHQSFEGFRNTVSCAGGLLAVGAFLHRFPPQDVIVSLVMSVVAFGFVALPTAYFLEEIDLSMRYRDVLNEKRMTVEELLQELPARLGTLCYDTSLGSYFQKQLVKEPWWSRLGRLAVPLVLHLPIFIKGRDPICAVKESISSHPLETEEIFREFLFSVEGSAWLERFREAALAYRESVSDRDHSIEASLVPPVRRFLMPDGQASVEGEEILLFLEGIPLGRVPASARH